MKVSRLDKQKNPIDDKRWIDKLMTKMGHEFGQWGIYNVERKCDANIHQCSWNLHIRSPSKDKICKTPLHVTNLLNKWLPKDTFISPSLKT